MSMALDIYLDPKDPESLLALAGTRKLLAQTQVEARWWPLQAPDRTKPKPAAANASRGDRHRAARAEYRIWELEYYASAQGIELNGLFTPCDSTLAAMGINWLQREAPGAVGHYLEVLMTNHWAGQRLDEPAQVLQALAAAMGTPAQTQKQTLTHFQQYCANTGRAELRESLAAAAEAGMTRGPGYLLNGEPYLGREHLPLLRSLIEREPRVV